jgi:predicted aspartyl protease
MRSISALRVMILAGAGALSFATMAIAHPGHPPIAPPAAAIEARQEASPFELFRDQRIFLSGEVNGTATDMLLDTGAGMTVVDRAFAERIGLKGSQAIEVQGAGGKVPGQIAGNVTLAVGGLRLTRLNVLIIDMGDVARGIGRPVPVVLGREAFKAAAVTIDFPRRTIRFTDRAAFRPPAGATRLKLGEGDRLPTIEVAVAGLAPVESTLDLGNGGTLLLAKSYWSGQPKIAALRYAQTQSGGVGGLKLARRVTLPQVEFGGIRYDNVPATLVEDNNALPQRGGNVGIGLFKNATVTIDVDGGALYVQPGGAAPDFARDRAGLRTELAGDRLKIVYVSPDGPAAAAGLKPGDEIAAVDGLRVDGQYYDRPEWNLGNAGRRVALELADGRRVELTLRDYY